MSSGLLSISTQALTANQSALAYTGQNIANVNTEGYSRQRVNFATQEPPVLGVAVQDVQRITDQFLVQQVWRDQSALSSSEQQAKKIELLDSLMVSDSTNLSTALDSYFEALQLAVDDPLFIANRQLFLTEADSLVSTFKNLEQRLENQQANLTTEARSMVTSINSITQNIAQLNVKIGSLSASGQNINSLKDERDQLVKELSKYVSVDVISSDGGVTASVLLANGEPLVSGSRAAVLGIRDGSPDPSQIEVTLSRGNVVADITSLLGEGALGGMFSYRDTILQPVRSEIGRLALVFSETMNQLHREGMDLNGLMGSDLFVSAKTGQAYASSNNQSLGARTSLTFYDVTQLKASDYEVEITGLNTFTIKRLSDGAFFNSSDMSALTPSSDVGELGSFSLDSSGGENRLTVKLDGFTFSLTTSGAAQRGDLFLLQPTINGARNMDLAITRPESLAFASPLRVTPEPANSGNAEVVSIKILDSEDTSYLRPGQLTEPVEIVFNALNASGEQTYTVYDITDPANPVVVPINGANENLYTAGEPIVIPDPANNDLFQITLANQPNPGDSFLVEYNTDGVSDNANALAMANLQRAETSNGYSYQDAYGQILAEVGSQANAIQIAYMANQTILGAAEDSLESTRGVNLDEEATRLIQYQQAYAASARLITTYQDIFDSLISAVR